MPHDTIGCLVQEVQPAPRLLLLLPAQLAGFILVADALLQSINATLARLIPARILDVCHYTRLIDAGQKCFNAPVQCNRLMRNPFADDLRWRNGQG